MQEPNLADLLREVAALREQVASQQTSLDRLQNHLATTTDREDTMLATRRKMLKRLAGGLVAGLAVGGATLISPLTAEAKLGANPVGNGMTNRVGALIMPPGSSTPTGTLGQTYKFGLIVSGDTSLNLDNISLYDNTGLIAYSTGTGVVGISTSRIGVFGSSSSGDGVSGSSSSGYGVGGDSPSGTGVHGSSSIGDGVGGASYSGDGVSGSSSRRYGVYGSGGGAGVVGKSTSGTGVAGQSTTGTGVTGQSSYGHGVYGISTTAQYHGIFGEATGGASYAGYFRGNVYVSGSVSKPGGSFKIDHPLDPANQYLYHSFVESPDMKNIYDGIVTLDAQGTATVGLPKWFETLNSDFRYGLTALGQPCPELYIAEEVKNGQFKVAGGKPNQRVSWQLTGIRQDEWAKAHRIPVEEVKPANEKGLYLHPELFGEGEEKTVNRMPAKSVF